MDRHRPTSPSSPRLPGVLCSFACGLLLFGIALGAVRFWSAEGAALLPSGKYVLFAVVVLAAAALLAARGSFAELRLERTGFEWALIALFFSDWLAQRWGFSPGATSRGDALLLGLLAIPFLHRGSHRFWSFLAPITAAILCACFLTEAGGRLIVSDDHATFFYRLGLLKDNFPSIPFYYPLWNGGIDARDFFPTGAINFFLITAPLTYLFNLVSVYNLNVLLIAFGLIPASTYLACRILAFPRPVPAIAALFAVSSNIYWYRWIFAYGTMGFTTSSALVPLCLAYAVKVLDRTRELSIVDALMLTVCTSLLICWTPAGLVFVPVILVALSRLLYLLRKRYVGLVVTALLAINLPWISVFWTASKVSKFLSADQPKVEAWVDEERTIDSHADPDRGTDFKHRGRGLDLKSALTTFRSNALGTNPVVLLLGVAGIVALPLGLRGLFIGTAGWLFALGILGPGLKPQLELDRMLLVLTLLLSLPAATAFWEMVRSARLSRLRLFRAVLITGMALSGLFVAGWSVRGRGPQKFSFAGPYSEGITTAIEQHAGNGRFFFSGFLLHELDGGHFAPLTYRTKHPLVGSFPVHHFWRYHQPIPDRFLLRQKSGGIEEYLDYLNADRVFAHEPKWRQYFNDASDRYEEIWRLPPFSLYRRKEYQADYFLEGSGAVLEQNHNRLLVRIDSPQAVLKFNYFDFLTASACTIGTRRVGETFDYIEISNCAPGTEVEIKARSGLSRVFGALR